jgi:peptidoglycan/LPS O-acetylase OafA/YrhL
LWLCFQAPAWARRLPGGHDISYGVYLYAFPIQLLLTVCGIPELGFLPYVAITVALTVPLALMSWLMVERPALRLKNRGPGRIGRRMPVPATLSERQPVARLL